MLLLWRDVAAKTGSVPELFTRLDIAGVNIPGDISLPPDANLVWPVSHIVRLVPEVRVVTDACVALQASILVGNGDGLHVCLEKIFQRLLIVADPQVDEHRFLVNLHLLHVLFDLITEVTVLLLALVDQVSDNLTHHSVSKTGG